MGERWFGMEYLNAFGENVASVFSAEDIKAAFADRTVTPLFATAREVALPTTTRLFA